MSKMLLFKIFGLLVSVVGFGTLVVGDVSTVVIITSINTTYNPNEYFDPMDIQIAETKKSSQLTVKMSAKKDIPDTMLWKFSGLLKDGTPVEYEATLCEALQQDPIGKSVVAAGVPRTKFPKECPIFAGNYVILKWDPPTEYVPSATPDGPINGSIIIVLEEGKEPYFQLDYVAEISRAVPPSPI